MAADVAAAPIEVEQHIGDALARAVIGVLPAAAALVDREPRGVEQILRPGAGAGGVERRVLQEPNQLGRAFVADRRDPPLHRGHRLVITHRRVGDAPLDLEIHHGCHDIVDLLHAPLPDVRSWRNW